MLRCTVIVSFLIAYLIGAIVCPPVTERPSTEKTEEAADKDEKLGLEYERYLKEVVAVLESDDSFRKKLEESNISDIKSGEIAKHLDFVSHGIRTRLDEIKRKEVDRLRQVMRLKGILQKGLKASHPNIVLPEIDKEKLLGHLDHSNPNTFEVADLAKLIRQATQDLEDIDKQRKEEFKRYEMEKEVLRREQLKGLDEAKRQEEEKKYEEMQKKHDDHPKLHHPGNEEQLKEVWEESDGLNKRDFDPKTFFHLHDTNSDGFLDLAEVEALFQQELDKVYDPTAPEDDMMERYEEMNRMREHLINEVDRNKDQLISLQEFLDSTKTEEFKQEQGWEPIDKETVFSEEELLEFQKNYEEQLRIEQEENAKKQQQEQKPQHPEHGVDTVQKSESEARQPDPSNVQVQGDGHLPQQPNDQGQQPVAHEQPAAHHQPVAQDQPVQNVNAQGHNAEPLQFKQQSNQQLPIDQAQAAHHQQQQPVVVFQQHQQEDNVPQQPTGEHVAV